MLLWPALVGFAVASSSPVVKRCGDRDYCGRGVEIASSAAHAGFTCDVHRSG